MEPLTDDETNENNLRHLACCDDRVTLSAMVQSHHVEAAAWAVAEIDRLRQQLADVIAERDRLRAELLQQPPTLEWLLETFGEPDCIYEKQAVWDGLFIWDRRGSRVYNNASQDALTTRAAVLEAVAAREIESEAK